MSYEKSFAKSARSLSVMGGRFFEVFTRSSAASKSDQVLRLEGPQASAFDLLIVVLN